eukprot:GCRY01000793.1.p1 GENE.GCRY01000793.1~~GCRY01000793.1.p1  ORF type:complete len:698 (+),score=198.06 GCRY01000793.1:110-2203(+)
MTSEILNSLVPVDELIELCGKEMLVFLQKFDADVAWPELQVSRELEKGDLFMMLNRVCGPRKINPVQYTQKLAEELNCYLQATPTLVVDRVVPVGAYLNIFVKRSSVLKSVIKSVLSKGQSYGQSESKKGEIVAIEHTSSNPNASLHIGNLRNVLIGAHLGRLMRAVGYEVRELFYVNDLGAQIGLTALAYSRVYHKLKADQKIDQWIGLMYAVMNTLNEIQKLGQDLVVVKDLVEQGARTADKFPNVKPDEAQKLEEYIDIYVDLQGRIPEMFNIVLEEMKTVPIQKSAAQLNLDYEANQPEAVKIFRKMVTDCLGGVQETLDTYNVRHTRWDFESELGWEGSNDMVMDFIKSSPYYVAPTQANDEGKPEGGYLDLNQFIADANLPVGKRGYQKNYPNLYVLRPDYSTLYSFRDVVYSLKKTKEADMVLNVICSEQNLAQEKVALTLNLLEPKAKRKQFHMSYDLVKLTTGRMSGRRGRYLLADDLYEELKQRVKEKMTSKWENAEEDFVKKVTHEVATCAVKYSLLGTHARNVVNFDIQKAISMEDASGPYILYNCTRISTIISKFEERVASGELQPLPSLDSIDFNLLNDGLEWELFVKYVMMFPNMIISAACPNVPAAPQLPEFGLHKTCEFLQNLAQDFSSFYNKVRIMGRVGEMDDAAQKMMHTRLYLLKALKTVMENALRLLTVEPLEKM